MWLCCPVAGLVPGRFGRASLWDCSSELESAGFRLQRRGGTKIGKGLLAGRMMGRNRGRRMGEGRTGRDGAASRNGALCTRGELGANWPPRHRALGGPLDHPCTPVPGAFGLQKLRGSRDATSLLTSPSPLCNHTKGLHNTSTRTKPMAPRRAPRFYASTVHSTLWRTAGGEAQMWKPRPTSARKLDGRSRGGTEKVPYDVGPSSPPSPESARPRPKSGARSQIRTHPCRAAPRRLA